MCEWEWNIANFIVQFLVAIGTLGAVIVALFPEMLKKPKLKIEFQQTEPYCRKTTLVSSPTQILAYWIRIAVKNEGKKVAKNCEGKLVEITEIRDEKNIPFQPFDPAILRWASYPDFTDLRPVDINREEYEYLNVVYTVEPGESETQKNAEGQAFICTDTRRRGMVGSLPVGRYALTLTIYGENADPVSKKFALLWNGKWDEIKMLEITRG